MARLFLGLSVPPETAQPICLLQGGIPGARWEPPEKLHLTLRFLGEVDGGTLRRLVEVLASFQAPAVEIRLSGVGYFPPRGPPRSLWVGVRPNPALFALQRSVCRLVDRVGLSPDPRRFVPHVTIARLRQADPAAVAAFLARHGTFEAPPYTADRVVLYRSVLARSGSKYRVEAAVPLRRPHAAG